MSRAERTPQAAAIAFRHVGADLQLCLIRRWGTEAWGIPKGLVDPGRTLPETALNESWEEAGIRGSLVGEPIGTYEYRKWGTTLIVSVYLMQVVEVLDTWPESAFRERRWVSFDEAAALLSRHPVRPLWTHAERALGALSQR